jgi:hypothetical protein
LDIVLPAMRALSLAFTAVDPLLPYTNWTSPTELGARDRSEFLSHSLLLAPDSLSSTWAELKELLDEMTMFPAAAQDNRIGRQLFTGSELMDIPLPCPASSRGFSFFQSNGLVDLQIDDLPAQPLRSDLNFDLAPLRSQPYSPANSFHPWNSQATAVQTISSGRSQQYSATSRALFYYDEYRSGRAPRQASSLTQSAGAMLFQAVKRIVRQLLKDRDSN